MNCFRIAIDGYSSTGKSTFAKLIASNLGFVYVDSGAIYRVITLYALQNSIIDGAVIDEDRLKDSLSIMKLSYEIHNSQSQICLNGVNVEQRIREIDVSDAVSPISTYPFVRDYVNQKLRNLTDGMNMVMDGRDIGTTVFPDSQLKIFMVADAKVRAERRCRQLKSLGKKASFVDVYNNLIDRDYIDSHRDTSPLKKAEDAIVLDNTYMTMDDQIDWIKDILRDKFDMSFNET